VSLGHHDVWQEHHTTSLNNLIVPDTFETDVLHPIGQNYEVKVTCNNSKSTSLHETEILLASVLEIFIFYWPAYSKYPYLVGQCTEIFSQVSTPSQHWQKTRNSV
jgi:hypothetical protein